MANRIIGTADPDLLFGVDGRDVILGKKGNDSLFSAASGDDVENVGRDVLRGGLGDDLINIQGGGKNQKAFGEKGNDQIIFGLGKDTADGGAGNDALRWQGEPLSSDIDTKVDTMLGGRGSDLALFNLSFFEIDNVRVTGKTAGVREFKINGDVIATMEKIEAVEIQMPDGASLLKFVASSGDDVLLLEGGGHKANTKAGDDIIDLVLDANLDTFDTGAGDDTIRLSFGDIDTGLVVNLKKGFVKSDGTTIAEFTNAENFIVAGSGEADDRIVGTGKADTLTGGGGNDTIVGNAGRDVMIVSTLDGTQSVVKGGKGIDTLDVFNGFGLEVGQSIDMTGTNGKKASITVDGVQTVKGSSIEKLFVTGSEGNDLLIGLKGNDSLEGGGGDDEIFGKRGKDLITTGGGMDVATGGNGADTFVFDQGSQGEGNLLTITDFSSKDTLALVARFFVGDDFVAGETPKFVSGADVTTASGSGSQFIFDTTTGELRLDVDGAGGDAADLLAVLLDGEAAAALSAAQIDIV